jgi:hypothetical protein
MEKKAQNTNKGKKIKLQAMELNKKVKFGDKEESNIEQYQRRIQEELDKREGWGDLSKLTIHKEKVCDLFMKFQERGIESEHVTGWWP